MGKNLSKGVKGGDAMLWIVQKQSRTIDDMYRKLGLIQLPEVSLLNLLCS